MDYSNHRIVHIFRHQVCDQLPKFQGIVPQIVSLQKPSNKLTELGVKPNQITRNSNNHFSRKFSAPLNVEWWLGTGYPWVYQEFQHASSCHFGQRSAWLVDHLVVLTYPHGIGSLPGDQPPWGSTCSCSKVDASWPWLLRLHPSRNCNWRSAGRRGWLIPIYWNWKTDDPWIGIMKINAYV